MTPSVRNYRRSAVLSRELVVKVIEYAFPDGLSAEEMKLPAWSPLYADLPNLPPALFVVGSEDMLVDDSVFMAGRWAVAGNVAELRIVPGAPHAMWILDIEAKDEAVEETVKFVRGVL